MISSTKYTNRAVSQGLMALAALVLLSMSAPATATETVASSCVARNNTIYNVRTDGRPALTCRKGDQPARFLEIVDTSSYQKRRGGDLLNDNNGVNGRLLFSLGNPHFAEVIVLAEDNGAEGGPFCYLYAWLDWEFDFIINLTTGERLNPDVDRDFGLLTITRDTAKADPAGVSYLLPNGRILRFSDLYLEWLGEECFASVTVQHDLATRLFAK